MKLPTDLLELEKARNRELGDAPLEDLMNLAGTSIGAVEKYLDERIRQRKDNDNEETPDQN